MAFVRAAKASEVAPGSIREVQVEGKLIALANVGGTFYAISNTCLHRGGPLGQGMVDTGKIVCPWHGWAYDAGTGEASHNPAAKVTVYPLKMENGDVMIQL